MITSPDNQTLKEIRKLQSRHGRSRSDHFVAEGEDLIAMASSNGWQPERLLVRAGCGLEGEEVEPDLLDSVSLLGSGTRAIAVYARPAPASLAPGLIVHLVGVADPGNVGTIIRSAHALGASAVSVGENSADPWSHKAVRASMGSICASPLAQTDDPFDLPGIKVALSASGGTGPFPSGDAVILVGAERKGLAEDVLARCDELWSIPMADGPDSLNAAAAASIALYAANRIAPDA